MGDLTFVPVFREICPIIRGQNHTTMYSGKHCNKNLILLGHDQLTVMLVFSGDQSFTPEFFKTVSIKDKEIKGVKIVGNNNIILMLDSDGNLWKLINAFEFSNEADERLYLLEDKCFYEWVPFRSFKFRKVIDVSALGSGFSCLGINKNFEKKLEVLPITDSTDLIDYTFEDLNIEESQCYHLANLYPNTAGSNFENDLTIDGGNESIMVTNKANGKSYICSNGGQNYLVYISNINLVCVINFERQKCLLLCYETGKLVFICQDTSSKYLSECKAYLSKKLVSVVKCYCCDSCIVWSDGINLHHTKLMFQMSESCFAKLKHLQVKSNIKGIRSFLRTDKGLLAVTINNFYYYITINKSQMPQEIQRTSEELLCEIYENGLKIDKLNREIEVATNYLEAKELIQNHDLSKEVEFRWEGKCITLKSNIKHVFKREHWRIRLLAPFHNKKIVEMKDLEYDLAETSIIKVETDLIMKGKVHVALVGDFGKEFNLLLVNLGTVGVDTKDVEKEELAKNLYEIAKRRNPYFEINKECS